MYSISAGDPAQEIVQSFAKQAVVKMPKDDLAVSLATKGNRDEREQKSAQHLVYEWQDLFRLETSAVDGLSREQQQLDKASRELAQAWLRFQKCLPDGSKSKVDNRPPQLADVYSAVTGAMRNSEAARQHSKTGRVKGGFAKLCSNLNDYKDLLAIVPSSNTYVSILAGSLSAIVKATANHEKIAESIELALDELSEDVPFWKRQMETHKDNVSMEYYITLLYVAIFKFLCNIMTQWYQSRIRRALRSFNGNFIDNIIRETKDEIKRLSERLDKEASRATQSLVSEIPNTKYFERKIAELERLLGERTATLLRDQSVEHQRFLNEAVARLELHSSQGSIGTSRPEASSIASPERLSKGDIERLVRQLGNYSRPQEDFLSCFVQSSIDMHIDAEVMQRIQEWFREPKSKTLWICGPYPAPMPSRTTLMSAYVTQLARNAGIPVLTYFCRRSKEAYGNVRTEFKEKELVDVVYSLLVQMLNAIQDGPNAEMGRVGQRCGELDGSRSTLSEAITLLEEVIGMGPGLVFCIVDGIEDLAYRVGGDPCFKQLLAVLRKAPQADQQPSDQIVKTLLATDGHTPALSHLNSREILDLANLDGMNEAEIGPGYANMAFLSL